MLKDRLIVSLFLIPSVIFTLFFFSLSEFILANLTVCIIGAWEWGLLAGLKSKSYRICLSICWGILLALMTFAIPICYPITKIWQTQCLLWIALGWWCFALLLILDYPRAAFFWKKSYLLKLIFGVLIIFPFFWGMLVLRQYHYSSDHFAGSWWLLYVMILVWSVDSGSYLFGRMLGRHKLAPKISPQKTWEGFIGGLFTSAVVGWLFGKYAPINLKSLTLFFCSVITVLTSILSDLTESMFKREAGIKDSGKLIPGHGGVLDRINGLTAAVPVFSCLTLLIFKSI